MSDLKWNGWIVEKNGTIREFYSGEARAEESEETISLVRLRRLKLDVISDSVCVLLLV